MATSTNYLPSGLPAPAIAPDGLGKEFWEGTHNHELKVQRCNKCGTFQFGPEWLCHNCHSFDVGWHTASGQGRIYSWERAWHPVHPALKEVGPYLVVLVELPDCGFVRLVGNLLGDPLQEVVIGAEVTAVFEDHPEGGFTLVQWRLAN
jgi:uncharacterized OB-fold protein